MSSTRCLVTGGAGFIGSNIAKKLLEKGYEVTIVDNLSNGNGKLIDDLDVEFIKANVSNPKVVRLFKRYRFKYIFNFGSPSTDRLFTLNGKATCETVKGMFNVIQISRETDAEAVIYPSSGTVYGNNPAPQTETMKLRPKSMYACTKTFLEYFSDTLKQEGSRFLGLRIFTGFGEAELSKTPDSRSVVSIFYESISNNIRPTVYGNGEQRRDFIYSDDISNIAITGAEKKVSGIINVGSGTSTSFNELIELLNLKLEKSIKPKYVPSPIKFIRETRADISTLSVKLGYKPLMFGNAIELFMQRIKTYENLLS